MSEESITIDYYGLQLVVNYYYTPGYAGDYNIAPEPNNCDIVSVYLDGNDITELLESSFNYVKPNYRAWELKSKLEEISDIILSEYLCER